MTRRYLTKNIRVLLTEGFLDEDLRLKVCYDEPAFRPVYNQLSREMGKDLLIDRLIEYACQNSLLDFLLNLLQELNPACYERHRPYEGEPDWDSPEVAAYLAAVANDDNFRYARLEGSDQRIALDNVFVMLQAAQIRPRRDVELTEQRQGEMGLLERLGLKTKKEPEAETKNEPPPPPPVEVSEVLSKHPHLVILGEPGGGKTTLLRYIALCLATNQAEAKLNLTEKYLPVFIELRDFNPDEPLEKLLSRKVPADLSEVTLKEWLWEGRLLFLFDDLDEAPPERQGRIREQLKKFATSSKWGHNRFILTSRIAAYQESSDFSLDRFSHYTLRPLTGVNDARLYAQRWLQPLRGEEAGGEEAARQLISYMEQQPGLRRVMSNPLQLRLAVIAYFEGGQAALTNRAELYRQYLEKRLLKREKEHGQRSEKSPPWQQVLTNLERLAWARHTAPDGRLAETQAIEILGVEGFERLEYLRQRTGLIVIAGEEKGEPLLAFSHQTYQEYLVARVLSQTWQKGKQQREAVWRMLKPRLHHPDWREPILLLAGLLPPAEAGDLLRRIYRARSPYENVLQRDLVLALTCLADGVKVEEIVSGTIITQAVNLITKKTHPLSSWLLRLPFQWMSFGYRPSLEHQVVELLGEIRDPRVVEPLIAILNNKEIYNNLGVVKALVQLGGTRAAEALMAALSDQYGVLRQHTAEALRELAGHQAEEPGYTSDHFYVFDWEAMIEVLSRLGSDAVGPFITAALRNKDNDVRRVAIETLGRLGDTQAVEPLIIILQRDRDSHIRYIAAEALGKLRDAHAVQPLIASLNDEINYVRQEAAKALGNLGDPRSVEPLIHALDDKDQDVRQKAAESLGKLKDSRAVMSLIATLNDESQNVRDAVLGALSRLGDEAIVPFINWLDDPNWRIRANAAIILGQLGSARVVEYLITILSNEDEDMRHEANEALKVLSKEAEIFEAAIINFSQGFTYDSDAFKVLDTARNNMADLSNARQKAAEVLGKLKASRAIAPLITALSDDNLNIRQAAVTALGQLGNTDAVEPLIESLLEIYQLMATVNKLSLDEAFIPSVYKICWGNIIRGEIVEALGKLANKRAVETLVTCLSDKDVRYTVIQVLSNLKDTRLLEPFLIPALNNEDKLVPLGAIEVLVNRRDPRAVEPLIALLSDRNLRYAAIEKLDKLEDIRAVEPLTAVLNDEDKSVRIAAIKALSNLAKAHPPIKPIIDLMDDRDEDVRYAVVEAIGKIGDASAVGPLIATLQDKNENIRCEAAEILGNLGDLRAVEPLITALKNEDEWYVRFKIAEALGKLSDPRAVEPLITLILDKEWGKKSKRQVSQLLQKSLIAAIPEREWRAKITVHALHQLSNHQVVEPLIVALDHQNEEVRQVVAEALGNLEDARAVKPLMAVLYDRDSSVRWEAARALSRLATRLTKAQCRSIARRICWEAASSDGPNLYEPLLNIATRLVVLEVEQLPAPEYPDV